MAEHAHPDGWMWVEDIAANHESFVLSPGNVITKILLVIAT